MSFSKLAPKAAVPRVTDSVTSNQVFCNAPFVTFELLLKFHRVKAIPSELLQQSCLLDFPPISGSACILKEILQGRRKAHSFMENVSDALFCLLNLSLDSHGENCSLRLQSPNLCHLSLLHVWSYTFKYSLQGFYRRILCAGYVTRQNAPKWMLSFQHNHRKKKWQLDEATRLHLWWDVNTIKGKLNTTIYSV